MICNWVVVSKGVVSKPLAGRLAKLQLMGSEVVVPDWVNGLPLELARRDPARAEVQKRAQ